MDSTTISKAKPAYKSMDYHFLREEGIKHIQKLAGSIWTDYNSHDPGITLLEVLCYAITDLGYRSDLPVEDLLASGQIDGNGTGFYSIREILPCNPVTVSDLRKFIIDQSGIRNAWVEKLETTPVRGLYSIILELEEDDVEGDLNYNIFPSSVEVVDMDPQTMDGVYTIEVAFPFWDELPGVEEGQGIDTIISDVGTMLFTEILSGGENANDYYTEIEIGLLNPPTQLTLPAWIKVTNEGYDLATPETQDAVEAAIRDELVNGTLVDTYWDKIQAAIVQVNQLKAILQNYRPLCEDFLTFRAFRVQEISIRADIDLSPGAQVEEVLSEVYYRIHAFLSPRPEFHTLEEMLGKGRSIEDIFEGPLLQHGFLDTEELKAIRQQDIIYTSDLLQLMTDVPGIIAVRDFRISNHFNNDVLETDVLNCLRLASPDIYKPLLSINKSQISCYKDRLSVMVNDNTVKTNFEMKKSEDRQEKQVAIYELSPPEGGDREVANYFSVQHHFPPIYGIGSEQLPNTVPDLHKAQTRQLKSYLIFFEQLLANYLSQLANIKSLFSMEALTEEYRATYFSQSLITTVPEATDLLSGAYEGNIPDITEPPGALEEPGVFHERRNRFLDHLIARFNESFSEYALFHYATTTENALTTAESLITNKINFLREYPVLGRDRARAFNYLAQRPDNIDPGIMVADVWATENVSGLKKRIARKLGLQSYERNYLFEEREISYYFDFTNSAEGWSFALVVTAGYSLESATINYDSEEIAQTDAATRIAVFGTQRSQYRLTGTEPGVDLSFELVDNEGAIIAVPAAGDAIFASEEARDTHIQGIISFLSIDLDPSFTSGGFHMIEHLLLRQEVPGTVIFPIPLLIGDLPITDTYSFRISFMLPMQHSKFGDPGFRRYAERVIHSETPAHIVPHIYWMDIIQMHNFEILFEAWLEAKANNDSTPDEIMIARNELILNALNVLANNGIGYMLIEFDFVVG